MIDMKVQNSVVEVQQSHIFRILKYRNDHINFILGTRIKRQNY